MFAPLVTYAARTLRRFGNYLIGQLTSYPELASILAAFAAAQASLEAADAQHEAAVDTVVRSSVARDQKRVALERVLRTVGHVIRRVAGGSRSGVYLLYFPNGMKDLFNRAVDSVSTYATNVLTKLQTETDPLLQSQVPLLSSALQELETVLRQHEEVLAEEHRTRALLEREKRAWVDAYRATYSQLRFHFSTNPGRAEDFFRKGPKGRDRNEEPASPAQTQTLDIQNQDSSDASTRTAAKETNDKAA